MQSARLQSYQFLPDISGNWMHLLHLHGNEKEGLAELCSRVFICLDPWQRIQSHQNYFNNSSLLLIWTENERYALSNKPVPVLSSRLWNRSLAELNIECLEDCDQRKRIGRKAFCRKQKTSNSNISVVSPTQQDLWSNSFIKDQVICYKTSLTHL